MGTSGVVQESELYLHWGNRKRNRCARTNKDLYDRSNYIYGRPRPTSSPFFTREEEGKLSAVRSGPRKSSSSSPENYHATRGSVVNGAGEDDGIGKKKNKVLDHYYVSCLS